MSTDPGPSGCIIGWIDACELCARCGDIAANHYQAGWCFNGEPLERHNPPRYVTVMEAARRQDAARRQLRFP